MVPMVQRQQSTRYDDALAAIGPCLIRIARHLILATCDVQVLSIQYTIMVAASSKNLWVAASDGDIERVKVILERQGLIAVLDRSWSNTERPRCSFLHSNARCCVVCALGAIGVSS